MLARAAAAETALDDLAGLRRGRLSIHASQTIGNYWLPARLAAFHAAYPAITLEVAMSNTAQVAQAVSDGAAELGLVEGETDAPDVISIVIDHDPMVLVVGADHAWAKAPPKDWALAETPWVLREPGSGTRSVFETALRSRGLSLADLTVAMVLPGNEAVRSAVEAGVGAAVMSRSVAASGLTSGALVEAPLDLPRRPFHLLRHRRRYHSKAGDAFVAAIGRQEDHSNK